MQNKTKNILIILGVMLYALVIVSLVFVIYKVSGLKESTIIIEESQTGEPVEIKIDNSPTNIISLEKKKPMPEEPVTQGQHDIALAPEKDLRTPADIEATQKSLEEAEKRRQALLEQKEAIEAMNAKFNAN